MAFTHKLNPLALQGLTFKENEETAYFDFNTAKEWFSLIQDGVPEDVALKRLEEEVKSADSNREYKGCYRESGSQGAFEPLTEAEYKVILMYCTEGYQFYLRLNEDCRKRLWKKYVVYTSLLHSVCMKLRNMPMEKRNPDNLMYRGLRCGNTGCPKTEFCWPGFTSATPVKEIAANFSSTIIALQSETGAPVRKFSSFFEYEVLFSPFFLFKAEVSLTSVIYTSLPDRSNFFISFPFYRGALLGSLVGNCLGLPFEFQACLTNEALAKFLSELEDPKKKTTMSYSCDTSTTLALAKSLIEKKELDMMNFKDSLSKEYKNDPRRNYGPSLVSILKELARKGSKEDLFGPAQKQFGGTGSHGNGGAMRVTPAALMFYKLSDNQFNDRVMQITRLTHAHIDGINGAILQATAVKLALKLALDAVWKKDIREEFIGQLLNTMKLLEQKTTLGETAYTKKLKIIQEYIKKSPAVKKVRSDLGTGMSAAESVPSAIYSFVRGLQPIETIPAKYNGLERTIIYAISLGGDTDTIASMAGAIAGAYYGQDAVTQRWRDLCEAKAIEDAKRNAKEIHNLVWN